MKVSFAVMVGRPLGDSNGCWITLSFREPRYNGYGLPYSHGRCLGPVVGLESWFLSNRAIGRDIEDLKKRRRYFSYTAIDKLEVVSE